MTKKPSVPERLRRQVQEHLLHLNDAERVAYRLGLIDIGHYPAL